MVQNLERTRQSARFPETAPAANPVFFRTYSRRTKAGLRETWDEVCDRTILGLIELGKLTPEEVAILSRMQRNLKAMPSGRWLWVGGTDWITKPKNFSGAYNCTSTNLQDWSAFGLMMDLAMMGCGTGAVVEPQFINQLPSIRNQLNVTVKGEIGSTPVQQRREYTETHIEGNKVTIHVGDSREGWVESYQALLELSTNEQFSAEIEVLVDISDVRKAGETLNGFGGVANPVKLPGLYQRCASILNKALGRQLNSIESCLLIDQAAVTIVAGNIRRCIAYGSRVSAIDGMKPIQDIQIGDLVLTSSGEYRPVVNKFVQGTQDVVEIRTPITSIRCTANHRVAVYNGLRSYQWKYAGELQPGDRLISVPHLKGQPCSTIDWAWLVGFFIGDGHADLESTKRRNGGGGIVSFAISTPRLQSQLGQKILRILTTLGYSPSLRIQGTHANINVYRKELAEELGQYKQPWGCPVIPEFVWRGNREIRAAFLAGLSDADGTPSRNVMVNSNKLDFLREIQKLALSLGIATTLYERKPRAIKGREKVYDGCHCIHIQGLQSQAVAVGLINQFAVRDGFTIKLAKKNGLTLPYQFVQQLAATGWKPDTLCRASVIWVDPKSRPGYFRDANFDTLIAEDLVNPHWLPMEVQFVAPAGLAETFDIEVEGDHEFIADGLLVHNSAGMRQFDSGDGLAATAKDNLWQQDESGNWRIDPERDALRMANHTRVFHRKPTLEECVGAVRKQYYSGEGAIQWAGEAVARSNIDLLPTPNLKIEFLKAYEQGTAKEWFKERYPNLDANELEHRLQRYALNPCGEIVGANFHCVSGDTLLITREGMHQIKDVVGSEIQIWNGQKWSQVTPFKTGSERKLYRVKFADGTYLDATEYHRFFVKDRFGKQYKEVQTKDLMDVSRYDIHTEPFTIQYEDGLNIDPSYAYTLGVAVGDGTTDKNGNAKVRLYEQKAALSVIGSKSTERNYDYLPTFIDVTDLGFSGEFLKSLKTNPESLNVIASWNRQAILHFIAGLADTDGTNTHSNGIRIYLSDYERAYRVQLLLTKCGIRSSLNLLAHKGSVTNYGVRSQDLYYLQITDCGQIPCQRLDVSKGCDAKYKGKWQIVRSVEELPSLHDTYCFNEPEHHKGVFGNTLTGNCNLSEVHLNQIDPHNYKEQEEAFTAGALSVAALLNHKFLEPRYQYSRELDPIVGVSFTGLFDFFVHAFGVDWLRWWEAGRPATAQGLAFKREEEKYLSSWRDIVHRVVWDYCDRHNLKRPNRCTTVQPSGTKALLTNASSGWHPPKAQRFIRRITFGKNDPVALACIDYGYNVIPSQSDKDEQGNLLNDPFDPRVTEWLVEIPVSVTWADLSGADEIDISKFSVLAQFDFVLQVQRWYVTHNTSATLELRSDEIESLGQCIYETIQNDQGYISAALLARFDDLQSFPRLPFEPIDKSTYDRLTQEVKARRKTDDFCAVLSRYDSGEMSEAGPSGCDSDKCMFPDQQPSS